MHEGQSAGHIRLQMEFNPEEGVEQEGLRKEIPKEGEKLKKEGLEQREMPEK